MVNYHALKDIEVGDQEVSEENTTTSINEIILRQIRKIGDIVCAELTGGYWEKKPIKTSGGVMFTEEYHQDQRESYCNAVDFLVDLVYATSDKEFREIVDKEEVTQLKQPERLTSRRKIFRELNKMFERTEFFNNSIDVTNTSK